MRSNRAVFVAIAIVLAGCGGTGGSTTASSPESTPPEPSPSVSTPAETTHAATSGEPALVAVPEYGYENDPVMAKLLRQQMDQMEGYKGGSIHGVTREGERIGTLILLQATPAFDQAVESGFDPTEPPAGSSSSRSTIAGERILTVDPGKGGYNSTSWIWYHDGTLSQFFQSSGATRQDAMDFVEAYLEEANR